MKNIGLYIYTIFRGNLVGKDEKNNKYYKSNLVYGTKKEKRWVLYNDNENDPTKINPDWHAWLHHIVDDVPNSKNKKLLKWQKTLSPNLTGTKKAYLPKGHLFNKNKSSVKMKNYESWNPNKKKK